MASRLISPLSELLSKPLCLVDAHAPEASLQKSIELNPGNSNGVQALQRLESKAVKVDASTLDKYAGQNELAPGFAITITRDGEKLFGQATGQAKFEMAANSPTEFSLLVVDAKIAFAEDGSSMTLYQSGRVMPAKRIK